MTEETGTHAEALREARSLQSSQGWLTTGLENAMRTECRQFPTLTPATFAVSRSVHCNRIASCLSANNQPPHAKWGGDLRSKATGLRRPDEPFL